MLLECVYEIQPAAAVAILTHSSFLHIYSIKEKGQLNIRYRTSFSTNVMLVLGIFYATKSKQNHMHMKLERFKVAIYSSLVYQI